MAITKAPKRATAPGIIDEQEKERRAEAYISGGGSNPVAEVTPAKNRKRTPVTMKWDPSLLERIDQAAERKGINRTAWVHFKLSEALDQEER